MAERVSVTVSGPTGSGKSAVLGEIMIALRAIGLTVEIGEGERLEMGMTHGDFATALDLYRPTVTLREVNEPRALAADEGGAS